MTDNAGTSTYDTEFPQELLHAAKRAPKPTPDRLGVDGWRHSWLSRLAEALIGKDRAA